MPFDSQTESQALSEEDWSRELETLLGYAVEVRFGRSRTAPVQLLPAKGGELLRRPALRRGWIIRLHEVFAHAPQAARADLAAWIRVGRRARRASAALDAWLANALASLPEKPCKKARIEPQGEFHDLSVFCEELLSSHFRADFESLRPPPVTWGRRGKSRTRGRLHLGSFSLRTGIVRVHSVLDQEAVPEWLVRYVLFHELLHAAISDDPDSAGRQRHHGPRFKARERAYADYARAVAWERLNLARLIRSARNAQPMVVLRG
ncbi:MAG: hypothetical protein ABGY71_12120 [bacterium]|nr:M48 family peptidase [Planctomycetota bacterium]HIL51902.1 M48 family peptidase [Planctomycetota bacterium]